MTYKLMEVDKSMNLSGQLVVALYRVSTNQQVGKNSKDELPIQKRLVQDFIFDKDMRLIGEFIEDGISGYKKTSAQRDKLMDILNMAKRKEFNVLCIYHSSRLGRLLSDTPKLIKEFANQNVRIFSVIEGELKVETQEDMEQNHLRYYANEQESFLKSEMIYDLSIDLNYGQYKIARRLNELGIPSPKGGVWHVGTIQGILTNPIYKGYFHFNSKVRNKKIIAKEQKHEIIIIPEERWTQNIIKMQERKIKKTYTDVRERRETKNIAGKMLLNSIAFCGHCGEPLTTLTSYNRWTTADGCVHKSLYYRYRCGSVQKNGGIKCTGQSTYGISKIEPYVISETKDLVNSLKGRVVDSDYMKLLNSEVNELEAQKKMLKSELEKS